MYKPEGGFVVPVYDFSGMESTNAPEAFREFLLTYFTVQPKVDGAYIIYINGDRAGYLDLWP